MPKKRKAENIIPRNKLHNILTTSLLEKNENEILWFLGFKETVANC